MLAIASSNCSFRKCFPTFTVSGMSATVRLENLKHLLEHRFAGKIAELARAVDRDDAYVWQLLNGDRNIGERVARHIEVKLQLVNGALDIAGMVTPETLTSDELELLRQYRRATPSWKIAMRYLAALRGDVQDEVSQSVNVLLAKVSADHAPDERVRSAYGKPGMMHEPASPGYSTKK